MSTTHAKTYESTPSRKVAFLGLGVMFAASLLTRDQARRLGKPT